MLEVGHFMLNNRGITLVETLMAFSIFVTVIVIIISLYTSAVTHHQHINREYQEYLDNQQVKEQELWQTSGLRESLNEVLP